MISGLEARLFRRISARGFGVVRATTGLAIVLEALLRLYRVGLAPFSDDALRVPYVSWYPQFDRMEAALLYAGWIVGGTLCAVGWRTRLTASFAGASVVIYMFSDQQLFNNHIYLTAISLFVVALGDGGAAVSVEARRRGERQIWAWPVVVLQAQLSIAYFWAALAKLNSSWMSGSVIDLRATNVGPWAIPDRFTPDSLLIAGAVLVVLCEMFMVLGPWSTRTRPLAFAVAGVLHTGILFAMDALWSGILIFSLQWAGVLLLFIDPTPNTHRLRLGVERAGTARWVRRLDWLHKVNVTLDPSLKPHEAVLEVDNSTLTGRAAVVGAFETFPLTYLYAPVVRPFVGMSLLGSPSIRRDRCAQHVGR